MKYRKEIITTAGTLACAVGIGFFMQNAQSTAPALQEGARLANADAAILDVQDILLTSADLADEAPEAPALREPVIPAEGQALPDPEQAVVMAAAVVDAPQPLDMETPEPSCEITATARPVAAAMVHLTLSATCLPNERVTVHHSGLLFHQITDAKGSFDITVPAMAEDAIFIMAFTNGEGAVAQTKVEEIADFDRAALQWKGNTGFSLHALEFGADYGTAGHVWSGAARDMVHAVTGQGGYLSRLGDRSVPDGLLAEVYTFPTGSSLSSGTIDLSVETEVARNNCGLEIEARSFQTSGGKNITSHDLTLSVPDCDAEGNFLVLNNLLEDLKVASR